MLAYVLGYQTLTVDNEMSMAVRGYTPSEGIDNGP
jgi:hypothetical protein